MCVLSGALFLELVFFFFGIFFFGRAYFDRQEHSRRCQANSTNYRLIVYSTLCGSFEFCPNPKENKSRCVVYSLIMPLSSFRMHLFSHTCTFYSFLNSILHACTLKPYIKMCAKQQGAHFLRRAPEK